MIIGKFKTAILIYFLMCSIITNASSSRTLFTEERIDYDKNWYDLNVGKERSLKKLINVLKQSITGKRILYKAHRKAMKKGFILLDIIDVAENSTADTTLIRKFFPEHPDKIVYEVKTKVFLNRYLNTIDAVLDLAHELTHYNFRPPFNPYHENFNLKDFIASTIEGKGGEVEAYLSECKVLRELFRGSNRYESNCSKLFDPRIRKFSRKKGIELFYRVGDHYRATKRELKKFEILKYQFPYLSDKSAIYVSSARGVPYPLAAIEEYSTIMDKVCVNDKKRIVIMRKKVSRTPASKEKFQKITAYNKMVRIYKKKCKTYYSKVSRGVKK